MIEKKVSQSEYKSMVEEATPGSRVVWNCAKAFLVGGGICAVGEAVRLWLTAKGLEADMVSMYTSVILIAAAVLLTGLGVFDKLAKVAGAGTLVPITGFANSVAAPAMEFKREGFVFGVGSKMFIIAGPVIVYGALASVVVGGIYYVVKALS